MVANFHCLIIDANSLGMAGHAAAQDTPRNSRGEAIQGSYILIQSLLKLLRQEGFDKAVPVLVFDDVGGSAWRYAQYPQYKESRNGNAVAGIREEWKQLRRPLMAILDALGILCCKGVQSEADDTAHWLLQAACLQSKGCLTGLGTADTDWVQNVRENVVWVGRTGDRYINNADFTNAVLRDLSDGAPWASPAQFLAGKMLMGDTSDDLPGIEKVGPKTSYKWLDNYGDIEGVLEEIQRWSLLPESKLSVVQRNAVRDVANVRRNVVLMDSSLCPDKPIETFGGHRDEAAYLKWVRYLGWPEEVIRQVWNNSLFFATQSLRAQKICDDANVAITDRILKACAAQKTEEYSVAANDIDFV